MHSLQMTRDRSYNYSYIWILLTSQKFGVKLSKIWWKGKDGRGINLALKKKISGLTPAVEEVNWRSLIWGTFQHLYNSYLLVITFFFFFFAQQGRGKKKQIAGNKIFNDRNENKLLLTLSRAPNSLSLILHHSPAAFCIAMKSTSSSSQCCRKYELHSHSF